MEKLYEYKISSYYEDDPSTEKIMDITAHYLRQDKSKLRSSIPMLNLLEILSIKNGAYFKYAMRLPGIFPITNLTFVMINSWDVHSIRSLVTTFDINVCRIGFVIQKHQQKLFLDFQVEQEVKKSIKEKKMRVLISNHRTEFRVQKYIRRGFLLQGFH